MTDIFISYASTERDRLRPLKDSLEARGWSVFWDEEVPAGTSWRDHIFANLKAARCVIVAWSSESIGRAWVLEEAEYAKGRKVLLPVLIDPVQLPFGFAEVQAVNLTDWNGSEDSKSFQQFEREVARILGRPAKMPHEPTVAGESANSVRMQEPPALEQEDKTGPTNRRGLRKIWGLVVAPIAVGVVAIGVYLGSPWHNLSNDGGAIIEGDPTANADPKDTSHIAKQTADLIKELVWADRADRYDARERLVQLANVKDNRQIVVDILIGALLPASHADSYRLNIGVLNVLSRISGGWSANQEKIKAVRGLCNPQRNCESTFQKNYADALANIVPGTGD